MLSYKKFEFKELKEYSSKKNPIVEVEEDVESSVEEFSPKEFKKIINEEHSQQFIQKYSSSLKIKNFKLNQASRDGFDLDKKEEKIIEDNIQEILNKKIQTIGKEAYDKAYQDGLDVGKKEAFAKYEKQAIENLEKLNIFIKELESVKEQFVENNEELIVEMIFRIIKMIVLKEVSLDKDYVKRLSKELILKVGLKNALQIKVSPSDLDKVKEILPQLNVSIEELRNLSIIASEDILPGGVLLETDKTLIDAEVETQLKSLSESLFK